MHQVTAQDIESMPPFVRQRFADQCLHLAGIANRAAKAPPSPRSGVLADLREGCRAP
jgi:hypothetical protein